MAKRPGDVEIVGYFPGALGAVCASQAAYYTREWGFGDAFEPMIAGEMAAFLAEFDPDADLFQVARRGADVLGTVSIDGSTAGRSGAARLRWFFVDERARGLGLGGRLLDRAMAFVRARGFEGLGAARHLYEKAGFRLEWSAPGTSWGIPLVEQKFVCPLV